MKASDVFVPKKKISQKLTITLQLSFFIVIFFIWLLLTKPLAVDSLFLPPPEEVLRSACTLFAERNFTADIAASVYRVVVGFCAASLIAIPLGIAMGSFYAVRAFFEPMIGFIRYMPASGFIPLLILWFGIGDMQKFSVIFIGTFFHLTLLVMTVVAHTPNLFLEMGYTLGATRWQAVAKIILPASLPGIFDNLRITMGWAWTYIVVAEIVAADNGIGAMIMKSSRFLQTSEIFVGIITVGILGLLFDLFFNSLDRRLFPYREREID